MTVVDTDSLESKVSQNENCHTFRETGSHFKVWCNTIWAKLETMKNWLLSERSIVFRYYIIILVNIGKRRGMCEIERVSIGMRDTS